MSSSPVEYSISPPARDPYSERQPPYSQDAEQAVLAAMLLDADAIMRAAEYVDDTMFYREGHRRLFRAMIALTEPRPGRADSIATAGTEAAGMPNRVISDVGAPELTERQVVDAPRRNRHPAQRPQGDRPGKSFRHEVVDGGVDLPTILRSYVCDATVPPDLGTTHYLPVTRLEVVKRVQRR